MAKTSNREKILTEGLRVVHERGFEASSVRDIVQAAGVPQGSFTNHFTSKEAFGLEILELYYTNASANLTRTLKNEELDPLDRLRAWVNEQIKNQKRTEMRRGCLFGNLTLEASEHSEPIRARLVDIFAENEAAVAACLRLAQKAGDLADSVNAEEMAGFIISGFQGALLLAKATRSAVPLERFSRVLFSGVLKNNDAPRKKEKHKYV